LRVIFLVNIKPLGDARCAGTQALMSPGVLRRSDILWWTIIWIL